MSADLRFCRTRRVRHSQSSHLRKGLETVCHQEVPSVTSRGTSSRRRTQVQPLTSTRKFLVGPKVLLTTWARWASTSSYLMVGKTLVVSTRLVTTPRHP